MFSDLTFIYSFPWYVFFLGFIIVSVVLYFLYKTFSVPAPVEVRFKLALLRFILLATLVIILLDPHGRRANESSKDWVGVLIDHSESMQALNRNARKRLDEAKKILQSSAWKTVQKQFSTQVFEFSEKTEEALEPSEWAAQGMASRLFTAIDDLHRTYSHDENLIGWIILSDGNATDNLQNSINNLEDLPYALSSVGIGDEEIVPNIQLEKPEFRETFFAGDILKIKVRWKSNLDGDAKSTVRLFVDGKQQSEAQVSLDAKSIDLECPLTVLGNHKVKVLIDALPEEIVSRDNALSFWVKVLPRTIHVFYVESYYKEKNLFKIALEEDSDFKVDFASSLQGFAKEKLVPFVQDPLYGFPRSKDRLFSYEAVILSDVKRNLLTQEQLNWLDHFIANEGGALIMVGGLDSFGDGGYAGSSIEKMLPVEISEEYKKDVFLRARGTVDDAFRAVLTPAGSLSPLMTLSNDSAENQHLWKTMPLLGGYNYVGRLKPGAVSLLEHPTEKSNFGPRVIMAFQPYGEGQVLAFTSDITPNWGELFGKWHDNDHGWLYATFWRNALKKMTENRLRLKSEPFNILREPLIPESQKPVSWTVKVPTRSSVRFESGILHMEVSRDGNIIEMKDFQGVDSHSNTFWQIPSLRPGDYLLSVTFYPASGAPLTTESFFTVMENLDEARHLEARHEILEDIARRTDGTFLKETQVNQLPDVLKKMQKNHLKNRATPFWNKWWIYLWILGLIFADWFYRKKRGIE